MAGSGTDRATGAEWRLVRGNPLLAEAPAEYADVFVVGDDERLFLVRADKPAPRPVLLGRMAGWPGR